MNRYVQVENLQVDLESMTKDKRNLNDLLLLYQILESLLSAWNFDDEVAERSKVLVLKQVPLLDYHLLMMNDEVAALHADVLI
jgi:hypothetical protein